MGKNASDASKTAGQGEQDSDARDADFSQLDPVASDISGVDVSLESSSALSDSGGTTTALNEEIQLLKKQIEDLNDRHLRTLADFENFKKRNIKERSELLKYQGEKILLDLLEVLDNLEFALQYKNTSVSPDTNPEMELAKLKEGLELIYKMFVNVLSKWEVRSDSGLGKAFDPEKFSAISRVPAQDAESGIIVGELKKAYYYKDKLLRFGEVVVSEGLPAEKDQEIQG